MTSLIISLVVVLASVVVIGYIIFKRLPDLKNLNIESLAEERQGQAKAEILEAKLSRITGRFKSRIGRAVTPSSGFLSDKIKKMRVRVAKLEEQYKNSDSDLSDRPRTIDDLIAEAGGLIITGKQAEAEKVLIEIIARDNKNIKAYEMLGDLYFQMRSYNQAEEIFKYLLKLKTIGNSFHAQLLKGKKLEDIEDELITSLDIDPQIAVYYEELGQVYQAMHKDNNALDSYLKATSVDPNNPKYLDKLVEASIIAGDRGLAKRTFNRLKKINPENAKLSELEATIEKL